MSEASTPSSFIQRFWALAIPACFAGLLQPLASFSDIAVLGQVSDANSVAAVGLASNYFDFAYLSFGFLRMGTTAWLAHWLAEEKGDRFRQELVFALVFAAVAASTLVVVYLIGGSLVSVPAALQIPFWEYTSVRILGAGFAMLNLVVVGYTIAVEKGKMALLHALLVHGSNVILNIVAVHVLDLGAHGVAGATVLSQFVGVLFGVYLIRSELALSDFYRAFHGNWFARMKGSIELNALLVLRTWLMQGVFLWAQYTALAEDVVAGAALTIWLRWLSFGSYFLDGLAHGVEGVAGQARKGLSRSAFHAWIAKVHILAGGLGLGLGLLVVIGGEPLHRFITQDSVIIEKAVAASYYLPLILLAGGLAYVLDGLSVSLASGVTLIWMVMGGALGTFIVAQFFAADGLLLAVVGLGAFMIGRVVVGVFWTRRLLE